MPEHSGPIGEDLLSNIIGTLADSVQKKSVSSYKEGESVSSKAKKLFGRQKSVHDLLGGGKSADVLLWRNKKISSGVLASATAIWAPFEWLDLNFMTITCFLLVVIMLVQFVWSNASGLLNGSPSQVPRLVLPDDVFVNVARTICSELNRYLGFLQDVACGGNLKQVLMVVVSLWAAAVVGSWCDILTVIYIGFVAVHTLPVLYEKYEDQVDSLLYILIGELQRRYQKLDRDVLSKIPNGRVKKFK